MKLSFILSTVTLLALNSCGKKIVTKTEYIQIPRYQAIEVPQTVPGTSSIVRIPHTVILDKGFGIKTFPKPISDAPPALKLYGTAVAKVISIDGSSGTGFFISEDGLFLTNEHVIPAESCSKSGCPGTKLVRDFHFSGANQTYANFTVLAQSSSNDDLDFTLLKVKLKEGEKVPFLKVELSASEYKLSDTKTYKALGHPGGATLKHTNALPFNFKGTNIDLKGLVIGGNSGGPLVDESTGKVVGLVKSRRTAFIQDDEESSSHQSMGRATSMLQIVRNFKATGLLDNEISKINHLSQTIEDLKPSERQKITVPANRFKAPAPKLFKTVLRKESGDAVVSEAISELNKYIGSSEETLVLDMMIESSEQNNEKLNTQSFEALLRKQIQIGRPLKFSKKALQVIGSELFPTASSGSGSLPLKILMNFFDETQRLSLQSACRDLFGPSPESYFAVMYSCLTTVKADSSSMIPFLAEVLMSNSYANVDDLNTPMLLGMVLSNSGISGQDEKKSLKALSDYLSSKNKDIESMVMSDAFFMNLVLGITGPGSFYMAFPQASSSFQSAI